MSSSNDPIRISVVGAGANTRAKHLPLLQAIPGVVIQGVVNRSEASARKVAETFSIPTVYPSREDAVSDPNVDAVVIGTWPNLHCPVTLAALANDKHVLTEARMAMDASEAHQMLAAAKQRPHLITQVVPSPMTLGVDQTIRRFLREGTLGRLLTIECRHGGAFLDSEAPLHWRQDRTRSGLNVMTMGIYYEAIMRWVGPAERVVALGKIFTPHRKDESGQNHAIEVPEHLDVLATMADNVQLHLQESAVSPFRTDDGIRLTGDQAVLHFHDGTLRQARRGDSDWHSVTVQPEEQGGWRVEEEFIRAIRGQETISHTRFEDGVRYMEFTEAVHQSQTTGQAIDLPLDPTPSGTKL